AEGKHPRHQRHGEEETDRPTVRVERGEAGEKECDGPDVGNEGEKDRAADGQNGTCEQVERTEPAGAVIRVRAGDGERLEAPGAQACELHRGKELGGTEGGGERHGAGEGEDAPAQVRSQLRCSPGRRDVPDRPAPDQVDGEEAEHRIAAEVLRGEAAPEEGGPAALPRPGEDEVRQRQLERYPRGAIEV